MGSFTLPLVITPPKKDQKFWELWRDFEYQTNAGEIIRIHKGFKTDGYSIPRIFWSIVGAPLILYPKPAVLHDYLYHYKVYLRVKCDRLFLESMESVGVNYIKRQVRYRAVRIFGWLAWRKYRRD